MELNIICPICSNPFISSDKSCKKEECEYNILHDELLISELVDGYNQSIYLHSNHDVLAAKDEINKKIFLYPFIKEILKFSFYLNIKTGDYENSAKYLKQLEKFNDKELYKKLTDYLSSNIESYNKIVSGEEMNINNTELNLFHYYLIYLGSEKDKKEDVISKIATINPIFAQRLSGFDSWSSNNIQKFSITLFLLLFILYIVFKSSI